MFYKLQKNTTGEFHDNCVATDNKVEAITKEFYNYLLLLVAKLYFPNKTSHALYLLSFNVVDRQMRNFQISFGAESHLWKHSMRLKT